MFVFLAIVLICACLLYSWIKLMKDVKGDDLPGPIPLPLLGNGHMFLGKNTEFLPVLAYLKDTYGDAVRVHLGHTWYALLSHPKYIEPVMSNMDLITKGDPYKYLLPWLGRGLLTATGQRWKTHRKFLTPAFHFRILLNFLPVFNKHKKVLIEKLHKLADGESVDLFPIMALLALDNVTESIMGVSYNTQKDSESAYVKAVTYASEVVSAQMRNPLLQTNIIFNFHPYKQLLDSSLKVLHDHTRRVINARQQKLKENNITELKLEDNYGLKNKEAFLDLLLLTEVDGKRLDDEIIREEVDTFMFEGHDTTKSGIVFSLYCIANNKGIQEKILEEQKSILGDDRHRDPTYNELKEMKYLDLVIRESLRLYPSVPIISRYAEKDTYINGVFLKKARSIIVNIFHMQRNPDIFDDPLTFNPERKEYGSNPYNWLAFSAGPRNCIGQKFAMMEMKVTIAAVVNNFKILPANIEPELIADLILRSDNGVHVKLLPRYL